MRVHEGIVMDLQLCFGQETKDRFLELAKILPMTEEVDAIIPSSDKMEHSFWGQDAWSARHIRSL